MQQMLNLYQQLTHRCVYLDAQQLCRAVHLAGDLNIDWNGADGVDAMA
jgi:hypothetical protein